MSHPNRITLDLDRRLLEHPRGYHLRRMRLALWLYLDLLARLSMGGSTLDMDPAEVGRSMGLPEGTIRSWLGHLRRLRYLGVERLDGTVRVRVSRLGFPEPSVAPTSRFFTVAKLERALGEHDTVKQLAVALEYDDATIRRALAGSLAVPEAEIRKSRTALFLYLLKRYAPPTKTDPRS